VPRPRLHTDDQALDAALTLFHEGGPSAVTTAAISTRSGAPTGSLYHRFGSRQDLLATLWLRTIHRFQTGLLAASTAASPGLPRALAAAGWVLSFVESHPADARLLLACRREELLGTPTITPDQAATLATLNEPIAALIHQLSREIFGSVSAHALELTTLAVQDFPYAVVRRHLRAGTSPRRDLVLSAVQTLLEGSP
jgi:AcrR family transcriptional regulator